ncbi:MAG: radical SAM protein [Acidobacteriota bacterium]|nr:radical SAM protein [Acidobacteriota bacterium]
MIRAYRNPLPQTYRSFRPLPELPLWDKMEARRRLLSFDLEITARCNNDCRHCYINLRADDRSVAGRELAVPEIDRLAGEAVSLGAVWCLVTGGEPLLREDFPEIYVRLKKKGLLVSVFTNACLVRDEHIALFRKYPPRDVEVTVYGATAGTYERVTRKRGSFRAFRRGLDRLLDGGVPVRFKAMAMRSNAAELPRIAAFCRARTKDYFRFDTQLHMRFDGNKTRNAEIRAERLSSARIVALERADADHFRALEKKCGALARPSPSPGGAARRPLLYCGAGMGSGSIGWDGTFRLCSSLWHPDCVFDARRGSLVEAWRDFVPRVRSMRSLSRPLAGECGACTLIDLCLWCPAHAHLETGRLDGKIEAFCRAARARARAVQAEAGSRR